MHVVAARVGRAVLMNIKSDPFHWQIDHKINSGCEMLPAAATMNTRSAAIGHQIYVSRNGRDTQVVTSFQMTCTPLINSLDEARLITGPIQ